MLLLSESCCVAVQNIATRLHQPRRLQSEPIIRPEYPWEARGVYFQGSVLRERRYRMWYSAIGARRREQQYLAYAESDDGVHFEKPLRTEWGLGEWQQTNVLYGQRFNVAAPNVHLYQTPRDDYRYFVVFDSRIEQHADQNVPRQAVFRDREKFKRHPNYTPDFDWNKYFPESYRATYLADSCDGLGWTPARFGIPGQSDGDHTVVWDPVRCLYRLYFRGNRLDENGHRIRQVLTASSPDTLTWSEPQLCLESDAIDDPRVNQIHGMTVTYRDGLFIGLIQMMEIEAEVPAWNPLLPHERARFHLQLAVSRDGVHFERVADRAEFFSPASNPAAFDHGMVRSGGQWVFDGDRMLMYYDGRPYKHIAADGDAGEARVGIGVAASPRDRFAGLTPRNVGQAAHLLVEVPATATSLALNCEVAPGAEIRTSLRYPDGCRVLPFTAENCQPIRHGGLRVPVLWKQGVTLPAAPRPMHIRFQITGEATIYAVYGHPES